MVIIFLIANFQIKSKIPTDDDGNLRYKLEMVAEANGISSLNARDAVVDSYSDDSILVRLINEKIPQLWESAVKTATKKDFITSINKEPFSMLRKLLKAKLSITLFFLCSKQKTNEVLLVDFIST